MHLNSEWLSLLPTILAEVLFVALFIVAAVRSRGVARILLSIWIVTSTVGAILSILAPYLFGRLGITGPSFVLWLLGMLNAVLLGLDAHGEAARITFDAVRDAIAGLPVRKEMLGY